MGRAISMLLISVICLSTFSCAFVNPKFKTGDMVISRLSGARGQIMDGWCRFSWCKYWVRFSLLHTDYNHKSGATKDFAFSRSSTSTEMFKDEYMYEHELKLVESYQKEKPTQGKNPEPPQSLDSAEY